MRWFFARQICLIHPFGKFVLGGFLCVHELAAGSAKGYTGALELYVMGIDLEIHFASLLFP